MCGIAAMQRARDTQALDLQQYIGRKQQDRDVVTAYPVKALIAALDRGDPVPDEGDAVPPGWHGLYFLGTPRPEFLRPDGLATETGVVPPLPIPRRMFAGQRITFHRPLKIGDHLVRESELTDLTLKEGGTGRLVFATQTIRISGPEGLCLEEESDTVFREAVPEGADNPVPRHEPAPTVCPWAQSIEVDTVMLFRYSALTFNGHRIHYDRTYATEVEGYPGLVVHGPLLLTFLINFARENVPGREITGFHMRARAPLFDTAPVRLVGRPGKDGGTAELWAVTPEGTVAMSAGVSLAA